MSLLVIGCGKMGGALVSRWVQETDIVITVADRSLRVAPPGTVLVNGPDELCGLTFDRVLIAVKPQSVSEVVPKYLHCLHDEACVLSVAAGVSIASLQGIVGERAIIRMMPNLPAEIGSGVTGYFASEKTSDSDIDFVRQLADATGMSVQVSREEDLDKVTAVAGSGTGYAFELLRCWIDAAQSIGLPSSLSRELVLATVGGAVDMARSRSDTLEALRNAVTSPKGTTAAGLEALNKEQSMEVLMRDVIDAALSRSIELR